MENSVNQFTSILQIVFHYKIRLYVAFDNPKSIFDEYVVFIDKQNIT